MIPKDPILNLESRHLGLFSTLDKKNSIKKFKSYQKSFQKNIRY